MEDSSKGRTKTWGFRRSTIARREFLEEVGELLQETKPSPPPRRGGRQLRGRGRAKQANETNPPMSKRGRGSRKNARNASLGSVSADCEALETSITEAVKMMPTEKHSQSEGTTDSEEISLKEYAERLKRRKQLEERKTADKVEQETKSKTNGAKRESLEIETSTEDEDVIIRQMSKPQTARAGSSPPGRVNIQDDILVKRNQRPARVVRKPVSRFPDTEEEEGESKEDEAEAEERSMACDSEDTDPDAVYCLCRQKHNKRFMICCDRCQEWFHGDCVGISEERGRLMEKNEEEYICPNCSPCPSPAPLQTVQTTPSTTRMGSAPESLTALSACEDGPSIDQGIKGKIRKASSDGSKKKLKIFQPGMARAVVLKEEPTVSKCIGPGCTKSALPDSVYCGHDCILLHAAVAMKSLTEQKPPKPEPPPEAIPASKPLNKPTFFSALKAQMKPLLGKVARKKSSGVEVEDQSADKDKEAAVVPSTQSEAVRAQQSSSIDPSVFYKSNTKAVLNIDCKTERDDDLGKSKSPSEVEPSHTAPAPVPASRIIQADFNLLPLNSKPAVVSATKCDKATSKQQLKAAPSIKTLPLCKKSPQSSPPSPSAPSCVPVVASTSHQSSRPADSKYQPTSAPSVSKALHPPPKISPQPSPSLPPSSSSNPSCSPVIASKSQQNPKPAVSDSTVTKLQSKNTPSVSTTLPAISKISPQPSPSLPPSSSSNPSCAPVMASKSQPNSKPGAPLVSDLMTSKQQPKAAPEVNKALPPVPEKSRQSSPPSTSPSSTNTSSCAPVVASKSQPNSKPAAPLVSDSMASKQQPKAAPEVNKALPPVPEQSPQSSPPSTSLSSTSPPSCGPAMASPSHQAPQTPQIPTVPKPKPSIQIRINVRRSLTDMLWKRVNDSDDLTLPESEVGHLAVNIEKSIYNMYNSTDSRYKNKYRLMMFNLKDPKNQVLFYRVMKGEISPSKLTKLSQDELQAREPSSPNISEEPVVQCNSREIEDGKQEDQKKDLKEELSISVAMEKTAQLSRVAISASPSNTPSLLTPSQGSGIKQNQPAKQPPVSVPDIISSMLKDTTSEHKTHLFDLKCRICTGQISADDDEPASKRVKKSVEEKPETSHKERPSKITHGPVRRTAPVAVPCVKSPVMESPASPVPEDTADTGEESSDFTPIVIPEVAIVSARRQDPRTAAFRSAVKPKLYQPITPSPPTTPVISEPKAVKPLPLPPPPPPAIPKSILTKPSGSSVRLYSTSRPPSSGASSKPPLDQDTRQFLLRQETIWKGFLNMQTVAKFVTKGYLVSGSSKYLNEDIPDTIHIGGRILPQTVWEYVERVKTSPSKDLCLIRFQPATDEEEVAYVSLFSYFNSRRRFGVVSNHCTYIKDFYLIPLGAHESVPSPLLALEGPGFERNRPNLLLGLAVCQRPKPPEVLKEEVDETRIKAKIESTEGCFLAAKTVTAGEKPYDCQPYDPEIPFCTTPPGSPDSSSSGSVSSPSDLAQTVLSIIKAPPAGSSKPITDSTPSVSTDKNPLQTILKTLFRKKEETHESTVEVPKQSPSVHTKPPVPNISEVDVIVQKYGNSSIDTLVDDSEMSKDDDRPYDPEEEYDPEIEYGMLNQTGTIPGKKEVEEDDERPYDPEEYDPAIGYAGPVSPVKTLEDTTVAQQSTVKDDVAYDPEDSTFFEEMQADLTGNSGGTGGTEVLTEQQRMLLELNKQIEEQKRQLEEQEEALSRQRAAAGMSMAHFSVSDALLSPPRTSYLSQCDLLQFAEKQNTDAVITESTVKPVINERRDPRQKREIRCVESNPVESEHDNKHTPSASSKSETISTLKTSIKGTPVSTENKTNTEKNTKMPPTEKVDQTVSADKSKVKEFTKTDTHTKVRSTKNEKSGDTHRHSHHHRSRHESRRTSRGNSRDLSPRKRRHSGDNHETKLSHTSSVSVKKSENKHNDREQFVHRDTKKLFSRQTSREQRRESPRESEANSKGPQRSFHVKQEESTPEDRHRDRGPGQNLTPRGPSRWFSDPDCQAPQNIPFHSNQHDGPHPSMHHPGPSGPFERPPRVPFENRGPRPSRSGPPGPHFRQFNMGCGPRMPNVDGPWKSNDNNDFDDCRPFYGNDRPVPPHMLRENLSEFSFSFPPNEQSERHRGGDWDMQRPTITPNRFPEQRGHNTPERTGPEFCGSGPNENFRSMEMVRNRRVSCPDPQDRALDPRGPLQHIPKSGSPPHRQTFEERCHPNHHGPDCLPNSRPRGQTSGLFLENKGQPGLCLDRPDNQCDALPRRHSGPLLPTPPGDPIGFFNPTMQRQDSPWPPQNPVERIVGFDREAFESDKIRTGPGKFEDSYQQNPRENKDPSREHTGERSEEGRMSDGGVARQRDRRLWPREQGRRGDLFRERGGNKNKGEDTAESEGEIRRPKGGKDQDFNRGDAKRARIRDRECDRDSYSSSQEDRNQSFHERMRGRGQKGGRFKYFGRKRSRGREKNRERS